VATRIVVDPVTRIEGYLRIEAVVEGTKITDALSSGTVFRGIEKIVENRDPRDVWAFVQRICGVCTHIHAIASGRRGCFGLPYPQKFTFTSHSGRISWTMTARSLPLSTAINLSWLPISETVTNTNACAPLCPKQNIPVN